MPDYLQDGLYFQGPHKVSARSRFRLVVRDLTKDELLDSTYLYIFFHKDIVFSGCLHSELNKKNLLRWKAPRYHKTSTMEITASHPSCGIKSSVMTGTQRKLSIIPVKHK